MQALSNTNMATVKQNGNIEGIFITKWRLLFIGLILIFLINICVQWKFTKRSSPVKLIPPLFKKRYPVDIQPTMAMTTQHSIDETSVQIQNPRLILNLQEGLSNRSAIAPSLPVFHKKWKVNCSEILLGNKTEIKRSVHMLNGGRYKATHFDPFMPPDAEVWTWTKDCEMFKNIRNYQRHSLSEEETAFPIAYIIVVHKGSAQVERLLRALYQPHNIHCIHPDSKSSEDFKNAIRGIAACFDNVFVASKIESVTYAGYTRLLADINCMRDLMGPRASGYPWRYVINLCGQDFPLKSNLEIVRQLKSYKNHNDIEGLKPPAYKQRRTAYHYIEKSRGLILKTGELKKPAPHKMMVLSGIAYYIASRQFVDYVLNNQTAQDLLEWCNDTYSPDENFWGTLQFAAGTPGGRYNPPGGSVVRFIRWHGSTGMPRCRGRTIRAVCVFSMGYLQYLTSVKHLFANKFDYAFDPIALQCLEEAIEYRTRHPEHTMRAPPVSSVIGA